MSRVSCFMTHIVVVVVWIGAPTMYFRGTTG